MPSSKKLQVYEKRDQFRKLAAAFQNSVPEFMEVYSLSEFAFNDLHNTIRSLYTLNKKEQYPTLNQSYYNMLLNCYMQCQSAINTLADDFSRHAASYNVPKKTVDKINGYIQNIKQAFENDVRDIQKIKLEDTLSLPEAIYKNYYETTHPDKAGKTISFGEYRKIMSKSGLSVDTLYNNYLKSTPAKLLADCNKMLEKNPQIYEYVTMPQDALYYANTGYVDEVQDYLKNNAGKLTFLQKKKLEKQIEAMNIAAMVETNAAIDMNNEEEISKHPRVIKLTGSKDPEACEIKMDLPNFQTSSQGCWSCGAQMLIHSRGNKEITQEMVRDYRAEISEEDYQIDKNMVDEQYNLDTGKTFLNMADPVLAYAPNSMIHELTIQQYMRAEEKNGISPADYLENAVKVVKKSIVHAITVEHSPVVFHFPGHYVTVVGIEGDKIKFKDSFRKESGSPNDNHYTSLKDMMQKLLLNKDLRLRNAVEITWISDIKLSQDGKTIHGIPSKYTEMNEDGTLKLPPDDIQELANGANDTGINKKGVRIYRLGGDEDNIRGEKEGNTYSDGGIVKLEKVYMPKQLNAKYLKAMANKRDPREEQRLNEIDKNFWGIDHSKKLQQDNEINVNVNENNIINDDNIINNDPIELENQKRYSFDNIYTQLETVADGLDKSSIFFSSLFGTNASYDNLSTMIQSVANLAKQGKESVKVKDGKFGPDQQKEMLNGINQSIKEAGLYLGEKCKEFKQDITRKNDPGKAKREQPRIKAVIAALDKLMDIRIFMTADPEEKKMLQAEKDFLIKRYREQLVAVPGKSKEAQSASYKNRSPYAEKYHKAIDRIDAMMGMIPEVTGEFDNINVFRKEMVPKFRNPVSIFRRVKAIDNDFKAIGSNSRYDLFSSRDFAALSYAATLSDAVYNIQDNKLMQTFDGRLMDRETRSFNFRSKFIFDTSFESVQNLSEHIDQIINSRTHTSNVLTSYKNGDKAPLAKLISDGLQGFSTIARNTPADKTASLVCMSEMGLRMMAMLDRDPELMNLAKQNGLTGETLVHIRSMGVEGDLSYKAAEFESKLHRNGFNAGDKEGLSEAEKLEYYTDLVMKNYIDEAREKNDKEIYNNPEYKQKISELERKLDLRDDSAMEKYAREVQNFFYENYGGYKDSMFKDFNDRVATAKKTPDANMRRVALKALYQDFINDVETFAKNQNKAFMAYEEKLLKEMDGVVKEGAKALNKDVLQRKDILEIVVAEKKRMLEEKRQNAISNKNLTEKQQLELRTELDDFEQYQRFLKADSKFNSICHERKFMMENVRKTQYTYASNKIKADFMKRDPFLEEIGIPMKYEATKSKIRDFVKKTGMSKMDPMSFYNKIYLRKDQIKDKNVIEQPDLREASMREMIKHFEKMNPNEKEDFAKKYEKYAEVPKLNENKPQQLNQNGNNLQNKAVKNPVGLPKK